MILQSVDVVRYFRRAKDLQALQRYHEAIACYDEVLRCDPNNAFAYNELAVALKQLGRYQEALEYCDRAIALRSDFAEAYCNRGNALGNLRCYEDALVSYERAIYFKPDHAEACYKRGLALQQLKRYEEALAAYDRAIALKPDYAEAFNGRGNVLAHLHRYEQALAEFDRAIALDANYTGAHNNRGIALFELNRHEEALASFEQAIVLMPDYPEAYNNRGIALRHLHRHEEALASYDRAIALMPDYLDAYCNRGTLLLPGQSLDEALASFRQALQIDPDYLNARTGEARALERKGDFEQSYAHLKPLLDSGVDSLNIALTLGALSRRFDLRTEAISMLERLLERKSPPLNFHERLLAHFELGKLFDGAAEYDRAFDHYRHANELKAARFSPKAHARYIENLISAYNADFMTEAPRASNASSRPIFIVGMPRSGTSLVEQILASHPQVAGGGELQDLTHFTKILPATLDTSIPYPQCIGVLTAADCDHLSQRYLDHLAEISAEALRVTDKMPGNFEHLGLIALLFPAARIIHCVRDPLDTCLSCYFQYFDGMHPYAYSLDHLGGYYRQYQRLMQHWRSILNLNMIEIRYEDLVTNSERVSRDIVSFCGLPWDEGCLGFHKSKRVVATVSYDQVRQPIHKRSVGRWRHYRRFLDPLMQSLADTHGEPGGSALV
jgi:tetratricopeptide (TPR) repeat protein